MELPLISIVVQFEFVLKGRGFSRAVNALKITRGFSHCGDVLFKLTHYPNFD
jgi:hypothetical protein